MSSRLSDLIRLAYNSPELREEILAEILPPMLGEEAEELESFERLSGSRPLKNPRGDCSNPHVRGKPRPGYGTCYQTHNEYGSANSGENGSTERADYMKEYRDKQKNKGNYDAEKGPANGKDRSTVPKPWGQSATRNASSDLVRLAHELPELREPILKLFFFKTALDSGFKSPSSKAQQRGCSEVFKDRSELTKEEKIEMERARKKGEPSPTGSCNRKINDYGSGASKNMAQYMRDYRAKGFLVYDKDEKKEVSSDKGSDSRSDVPDWAGKVKGENNPSKLNVQKERDTQKNELKREDAKKAPTQTPSPTPKKNPKLKKRRRG